MPSARVLPLARSVAGEGNVRVLLSGRHSGGETPVPIPNTAVKPSSADGTVAVGVMGE
jgi:hypothetical protein